LHRGSSFDVDEGRLAQDRRLLRGSRFRSCLRNPTHRALPPLEDCQYITIWDQSTYVDCGQASLRERQARYGYRSRITVGLYPPAAGISCSSPTPDQATCATPAQTRQLLEDIHLFAAPRASRSVRTLHSHRPARARAILFDPGEREALRWAMDGMTRWEVG
jgi:hypothetical protein